MGWNPSERRYSVSSESFDPEKLSFVQLKVIPKTPEESKRIRDVISGCVLFRHLDQARLDEVVDLVKSCQYPANVNVVEMGSIKDDQNMFVVDSGTLEVFYQSPTPAAVLETGSYFGEIALMYGCPRTATVRTKTPCRLWSLDRNTFRKVLMDESIQRKKLYESVLLKVPLFSTLYPYERSKIADALETCYFRDGDVIIKQGDPGDLFYIIESGEVICTKEDVARGSPVFSCRLKQGDYFGELALILNEVRQATVTAKGPVKCLTINRSHWSQVLGPVEETLRKNVGLYKSYEELITSAFISDAMEEEEDFTNLESATRIGVLSFIEHEELRYIFHLRELLKLYSTILSSTVPMFSATERQLISSVHHSMKQLLITHMTFTSDLSYQLLDQKDATAGDLFIEMFPHLGNYQNIAKSTSVLLSMSPAIASSLQLDENNIKALVEEPASHFHKLLGRMKLLRERSPFDHLDVASLDFALKKYSTFGTTLRNISHSTNQFRLFAKAAQ